MKFVTCMALVLIAAAPSQSHSTDNEDSTRAGSPSTDDCRAQARAAIARNVLWVQTEGATVATPAVVDVRLAPNGQIVARFLVKSSGSRLQDDALLKAIDRTANLPDELKTCRLLQITVAWAPQLP